MDNEILDCYRFFIEHATICIVKEDWVIVESLTAKIRFKIPHNNTPRSIKLSITGLRRDMNFWMAGQPMDAAVEERF